MSSPQQADAPVVSTEDLTAKEREQLSMSTSAFDQLEKEFREVRLLVL
jgi:hypothetical protein